MAPGVARRKGSWDAWARPAATGFQGSGAGRPSAHSLYRLPRPGLNSQALIAAFSCTTERKEEKTPTYVVPTQDSDMLTSLLYPVSNLNTERVLCRSGKSASNGPLWGQRLPFTPGLGSAAAPGPLVPPTRGPSQQPVVPRHPPPPGSTLAFTPERCRSPSLVPEGGPLTPMTSPPPGSQSTRNRGCWSRLPESTPGCRHATARGQPAPLAGALTFGADSLGPLKIKG